MIARMSKVEVIGPRGLLEKVLSFLQELCIFQIEPATIGFVEKDFEEQVRSYMPDESTLSEALFLEGLKAKIKELMGYLPDIPVRVSYLEPLPILDTISKTLQKHTVFCRDLSLTKESLQKEVGELSSYAQFLASLSHLLKDVYETPDLDFIGLTIKEPGMVGRIRELLSRLTDWKYELLTEPMENGSLIGLIAIEKDLSSKVKTSLSDEHIPELHFPPSMRDLSYSEKSTYLKRKVAELNRALELIKNELEKFSHRWMPLYKRVYEWIEERLSLLKVTASVFETRMCFFINGWMPSENVAKLRNQLVEAFGGKVALEEREIYEEDLERVPIVLKNPPYFKPFELLVKLLPLPKYTSFDPTPFIGIFFPVFFGMILGDAGYGLILTAFSLLGMKKFRKRKEIRDASKILLISSLYSIFFGILYGEFFGDLGEKLFHLKPLWIERRAGVIPMLIFAFSVGMVHVLIGLFLGFLSALKRKIKKEAMFKFVSIMIITFIAILVVSSFQPFPWLITRPVILAILILTPVLLFTGGLLAPLELLKSIGNIISYARIMAIGLTSVLLAFVANELAGLTGDIIVGIVVAGLLHVINIILGVFSPAIHSLRLHYVEFFSKFVEHGGRKFEPFKKER